MNKALLIIDVQNDYFPNGKCELHQPELALSSIKKLLRYFRDNKLPVYHIKHLSEKNAAFFVPNTDGVNIHKDIMPLDSEKIIIKHYPNSFFETDLQAELSKERISDIVICGMMTHMCVDTTVRAAKDYGYNITLVSDACATKDLEWNGLTIPANIVQDVYMASINSKFANVITSENILE
ncbi:cysteine hydrolase family protein [Clostridium aminobutyricum]|uniref:Cysteine hydrolase n=1 Tax=Clostridium aminobutyricum TaxID=33953 RepID=A0A939D731_CLOAM|nr:cysteine hydrolase family protein [Clostridium aminobutyricum]MBN7772624.1 cysteine hydrolase [Clostridium aminobutyricum]